MILWSLLVCTCVCVCKHTPSTLLLGRASLVLLLYKTPNELTCELLACSSVFASHFTDTYLSIQHLMWVLRTELSNQVFLLSESPPWHNSKSRNWKSNDPFSFMCVRMGVGVAGSHPQLRLALNFPSSCLSWVFKLVTCHHTQPVI